MHTQWVIIDSRVYDVTKFKDLHPGGTSVFLEEDIRACHTINDEMRMFNI